MTDRVGFAALPKLPAERDENVRGVESERVPPNMPDLSPRPFDSLASLTSAHTNLNARLTPFWSKALINRRVKLAVYTIQGPSDQHLAEGLKADPLWEDTANTDDQGLFTKHITIPWDRLCTHPPSIAMACCDPKDIGTSDWRLLLKAGIDRTFDGEERVEHPQGQNDDESTQSWLNGTPSAITDRQSPRQQPSHPVEEAFGRARDVVASHLGDKATTQITIAVSEPKGVRVISDLVSDRVMHPAY